MSRKHLIIAALLLLAVTAIAVPLLLAARAFDTVELAERGTLAYRFGVPAPIKAVPVEMACLPALYDHVPADPDVGRPTLSAVSYASSAEPPALTETLRDHFLGQDCRDIPDGVFGAGLLCPSGDQVFIQVQAKQPCGFANVIILGTGALSD